jgi:hypothetical protein
MAHRLDVYDHLGRFGGLYLHMFGDCYRYAKGAVIASSAYKGEPQTRRDDAFAWFIARHPERAEDVAILRTIEPHYLLTMNKGSTDDLPFPAQDCHELAQSVLDAAKRIIAAAYV